MPRMRSVVAVFAVLALAAVARADTAADHVRIDLTTLEDRPGGSFTLAVHFHIDPGWHIYWTNPGDSGTPTRVKLDLPPGWSAGETLYPTPAVLTAPGNITNYGYESGAGLLVRVTPGPTPPPGPLLTVHVDYLVCKDVCLPGRATLVLDRLTANPHMSVAMAATHMPRPLDEVAAGPLASEANFGHGGAAVIATIHWRIDPPRDVTWIPDALDGWSVDDLTTRTEGRTTTVRFSLATAGGKRLPARVNGLLISQTPRDGRTGYVCPVVVTAAAAPSTNRSRP